MSIRPEDVPADPARLAAMVLALDAENERLRAIVRTLKDLLFGARSEKAAVIDVAQLPLDLDDLAVGPPPPPPPANDEGGTERKGGRPRRPAVRNPLGPTASLHQLRRGMPRFVRRLRRYYQRV